MAVAASIPAVRGVTDRPHLCWTFVHNFSSGLSNVFVRWLEGDIVQEAQFGYWLSYDWNEKPHTVRFAGVPTYMNRDTLDELTADVFAAALGESTDWMVANRAQVVASVPVVLK